MKREVWKRSSGWLSGRTVWRAIARLLAAILNVAGNLRRSWLCLLNHYKGTQCVCVCVRHMTSSQVGRWKSPPTGTHPSTHPPTPRRFSNLPLHYSNVSEAAEDGNDFFLKTFAFLRPRENGNGATKVFQNEWSSSRRHGGRTGPPHWPTQFLKRTPLKPTD